MIFDVNIFLLKTTRAIFGLILMKNNPLVFGEN